VSHESGKRLKTQGELAVDIEGGLMWWSGVDGVSNLVEGPGNLLNSVGGCGIIYTGC